MYEASCIQRSPAQPSSSLGPSMQFYLPQSSTLPIFVSVHFFIFKIREYVSYHYVGNVHFMSTVGKCKLWTTPVEENVCACIILRFSFYYCLEVCTLFSSEIIWSTLPFLNSFWNTGHLEDVQYKIEKLFIYKYKWLKNNGNDVGGTSWEDVLGSHKCQTEKLILKILTHKKYTFYT